MKTHDAHLRIARPTLDPSAIRQFYVQGLGMSVLYQSQTQLGHRRWQLMMCGFHDATWHLEFTLCQPHPAVPSPTPEDLLVFYLGSQTAVNENVATLQRCGGSIVRADNPYWDDGGITVVDPDGYRLVVTSRKWE